MVQIHPSVVACLLFLDARDDVKSENKNKKMFQPLGQKLEQHESKISLAEEYEHKNQWAWRRRVEAMSLKQSRSIKNR